MPIKIPNDLPARVELEREGLMVMSEADAVRQDIRPMRIGLLNLMPQKQKTETQLARLIGATPLQIELTLVTTGSYVPTNVSAHHLSTFYRTWDEVKSQKFDGFIVTGAPVETLPFEKVLYWQELEMVMDWTLTHVHSTLDICWGAQAALHHFHRVPKHELPEKMFGVYPHRVLDRTASLLRGFSDELAIPVSRHTETRRADVEKVPGLEVLIESDEAGVCLVQDKAKRHIYMLNHLEYDAWTLRDEYQRDVDQGLPIEPPKYYFPENDPSRDPPNTWRGHAHLFIGNWINDAYQTTPFDTDLIGMS
ncbi:homoserine O-succinyltransferase [Rhodospirillaceae bacterium KN72]|uniref:Homoserine O-acetyltransferase n=1 Tax=Pacificispira spongiicola TaxID=2729598 RepID=A0A7Y0DXR0_9PROT|nr:homoserine O-succinyltransferase [Pacificispira spongiicola]NMM43544.1 homoserine O-succinyltransferase [Pacificispira spongiicola]